MAISIDATASGGSNLNSGESSFTWNHTCSADAGILVVMVAGQTTLDVSGVTYNGVALTQLSSRGIDEDVSIWYLLEPDSGTNAIVVSKTSSNAYAGAASISFDGNCDIASTASANGNGTSVSVTNTTAESEGYTLTALGFNDPNSLTYTGGGTEFVALTRGPGKAQRFVYNDYSGGANNTETWTNASSRSWDALGCEVFQAGTEYTQNLDETVTMVDTVTKTTSRALSEGATLVDSISRTLAKTFSEIINLADGWGNAMTFDGSNDYATSNLILPVTGFTIEFWYTPSKFATNDRVIDQSESGPTNGFNIVITSTNRIQATFWNGASATASLTSAVLTAGEKYHIAVTFDGTISKLFVNGSLVAQDTSSTMSVSAQSLTIGRRSAASTNFAGFSIDDLRIYFATIADADIANHALNRYSGESNLRLYWDFNQISGTTIPDKSGNGNNGIIFPDAATGPQIASSFVSQSVTYASGLVVTRVAYSVLSETITLVDNLVRGATKALSEVVTLVATFSTTSVFIRTFDEVVTLVDTLTRTVARSLSETVELVDSVAKTLSRALDEAVTIVASVTNIAGKVLSEAATLVDTLTRTAGKALTETVTLADHVSVFLNGILQGLWAKTARITSSWSSVVRKVSDWTKIDRE